MITIEEIFNLIKQTVNLSGGINDYSIRISNGRFDRENLIGIYRIREGIAINQQNHKLAKQMHHLLKGLKSDSEILLKGVTVDNKNYSGTFYLNEDWSKVIGYLESENGNESFMRTN